MAAALVDNYYIKQFGHYVSNAAHTLSSSPEGAEKTVKLANRILFWLHVAVKAECEALKKGLKDFILCIESIDFFKQGRDLVVGGKDRLWQGTAALTCLVVFRGSLFLTLLSKWNLINKPYILSQVASLPILSSIVANVGQIPVIGVLLVAKPFCFVCCVGVAFKLWDSYIRYTVLENHKLLAEKMIELWTIKKNYIANAAAGSAKYTAIVDDIRDIRNKISSPILGEANVLLNEVAPLAPPVVAVPAAAAPLPAPDFDRCNGLQIHAAGATPNEQRYVRERTEFEIARWTVIKENSLISKDKLLLGALTEMTREMVFIAEAVTIIFAMVITFAKEIVLEIIKTVADSTAYYKADVKTNPPEETKAKKVPQERAAKATVLGYNVGFIRDFERTIGVATRTPADFCNLS